MEEKKYPCVKMLAVLEGTIDGKTFKEYSDLGLGLSFGGFSATVTVGGKSQQVNFDWSSYTANVSYDNTLAVVLGDVTVFGGDGKLDDIYDEEYEKAGFSREDLTAKVLGGMTGFNEFCIGCVSGMNPDIHIRKLSFVDDKDFYPVDLGVMRKCVINYTE